MFQPDKIRKFPTLPGVYIMKNRNGTVLYVGKAKNLRQRVRQYFVRGGDGRYMIPYLVEKVVDIETIVVKSEKEALLLENNLIKQYQPKYNVLLKDDKSYIALKIAHKDPWPRVDLVRYRGRPKPDGLYFGPYTNAGAARKTLDLLHKLFPLRQCSNQEFARRTRPCILYDMKRCVAPCVGKCTREEYDRHVKRTVQFLRGQDKEVLKGLYKEREHHSEALEFEKAGALHKSIRYIEKTIETQHVDKPLGKDQDVVALYRQGDEVILCLLTFKKGRLEGSRHYAFSQVAQADDEMIESFLLQEYEKRNDLPHEILVETRLPNAKVLGELLTKERKVKIVTPQRGEKRALIELAQANARATFKKEKDAKAIMERTLLQVQEQFRLSSYPHRIECFDTSHISGDEPVAALVVFVEGKKEKSAYRKYKVKTADASDDYGAMYEVLLRRYKRAKEENNLPNLLIVDGGKGQLNVARKVMQELDIITINLIGLAKEEGRHDRGMTAEQVYLPNVKDPIRLKRTSPILFLFQQIRDETHRFAITFHRSRRSKKTLSSALDAIPGIGPVKRKLLLQHFKSVKRIKEASREALLEVKGITKTDVIHIHEWKDDRGRD